MGNMENSEFFYTYTFREDSYTYTYSENIEKFHCDSPAYFKSEDETIINCPKKNKNVNTSKYKSTKISRKASQDITIDKEISSVLKHETSSACVYLKEFNIKNKLSDIDEMHNMGLPCNFSSSKEQKIIRANSPFIRG